MKRTTVWVIAIIIVGLAVQFSFLSNAARAQDVFAVSATKAAVDGVVDPAERTCSSETKGLKLFLTRTSSSLYEAVSVDTTANNHKARTPVSVKLGD